MLSLLSTYRAVSDSLRLFGPSAVVLSSLYLFSGVNYLPIPTIVVVSCKAAYASVRLHRDMVAHMDSSDYICRRVDIYVR